MTPPGKIAIAAGMWENIIDHLRRSLPAEGCGLLAAAGPRGVARSVHFFPGTNQLNSATRFRMADREVIDAHRIMRERNWWLAAIVHSHPNGPATPSRTDLQEAYYPDAALLIVDLSGPEPVARAWSVQSGHNQMVSDVPILVD